MFVIFVFFFFFVDWYISLERVLSMKNIYSLNVERSKCGKGLIWPPKSKFFKSIVDKVKMYQKASKILKQVILLKKFARLWKYGSSKVDKIEHFCEIPYKTPILGCIFVWIIYSAHPYHPDFLYISCVL